jgi:hypothetical protein
MRAGRQVAAETVAQTTVDALVAALGLDRLDFLKADIEGGELRMLEGARKTLARLHPHPLIELTAAHLARAGDTLADAFGFLAARGYRAFALEPTGLSRSTRRATAIFGFSRPAIRSW